MRGSGGGGGRVGRSGNLNLLYSHCKFPKVGLGIPPPPEKQNNSPL